MDSEQKRAFAAIVLSGVILFSWQAFFQSKTPVINDQNSAPIEASKTAPIEPKSESNLGQASNKPVQETAPIEPVQKMSLTIKNGESSLTVNEHLSVVNLTNSQASLPFEETITETPFHLYFLVDKKYQQKTFRLTQTSNKISGSSTDGSLQVEFFFTENGFIDLKIVSAQPFKYKIELISEAKRLENNQIRKFALYSDSLDTIEVGSDDKGDTKLKWVGIDFNFHLFSVNTPDKQHIYQAPEDSNNLFVKNSEATVEANFKFNYVKKEYDHLLKLGNNLESAVDYGVWSVVAVPLFRALQFFHGLIPNWGFAIILLTLLVRLLTFPLQYKSFKSMKKMQEIQPELTKIREKYKDNPQKLQTESMGLFKKSGASPLGGCLPLLLQMPIFFAFYQVLYQAVELVGAPFIFWIQDLSIKDPYYILPVLMGGAMFLQQRLTPTTTADPTQKKVMMFMPLIFGFIMKDLPSGLTLYIFISTLLGMLQQLFVYKRT